MSGTSEPAHGGPARDLVGYGRERPHPRWPGDARVAVQIVINYEEGSEYAVAEGDGRNEIGLADAVGGRGAPGERDLAMESMYEFGSRVGVWRLLDLLAERGLPATVFGCALALERNPAVAEAVARAGHDVCLHGWRWVEAFRLTEDEEREHIARAVASVERTVGERPLGWYCRYGPSVNTRRLLVEHGGFLYDSDAYNDELPYWTRVADRDHLVVPYALDTNDVKLAAGGGMPTGDDFHAYLRDALDLLRAEGRTRPGMMSIGLHTRIAGRPGRAAGLARFLDHLAACDDVWVCRRLDLARHWIANHPPPAAGEGEHR